MGKMSTIGELLTFLIERRKYFLAPLIIALGLMIALILLAEIPVLTPFIYAIF